MLRISLCLAVALWLHVAAAYADEPLAPQAKSIEQLVKELDAEGFAERQAASEALAARGTEAIDALCKAAQGESAEAATRSLEILRKHLESGEAEVKEAAKASLQKLAAGEGAVARRAAEVLTPKAKPPEPPAVDPRRGIVVRPGIRMEPGIRVAFAAGGGGKRVTVKDIDGKKEIEVVEEGRITRIEEDPAKSIKVKITETKDGKDETKEFEAEDAEELKKEHPEAHKLYEQYAKGVGGVIRIDGGPAIRRFDPPAIIREPRAVVERLEKAQKQLEDAAERIKAGAKDDESLRAALEAIEASKKELEDVKAQFPLR